MRLTKATIRNYRLHREVSVQFDPHRTLIGGPNESGKSTLIEAIHRALFLRARTGGEAQKSMVSSIHAGHPEVELEFEKGAKTYLLLKRFSGPGGTVTLTETGGPTWSGDEAETRLAELIGVDLASGGRGAGDRAAQQWAHLWTWQGLSGQDPTTHANEQRDSLLARLQAAGGGAAMQSELDASVANVFALQHDQIFTKGGDARAGSDLHLAQAGEAAAAQSAETAREAVARLDRAVADFRDAGEIIAAAGEALDLLGPQRIEAERKLALVEMLRSEERAQSLTFAAATERHETLTAADARLAELRRDLARALEALAPVKSDQKRLVEMETECRMRDAAAEAALTVAAASVRRVRLRCETMRAHIDHLETSARRDRLQQAMNLVREARETLAKLEENLGRMPAPTDAKLKALHKLEREWSNAQSALDAMATGIEVVAADAKVMLGARTVVAGATEILSEETDLRIGEGIHLRIRPGGGTGLAETRQRVSDLRGKLARELDGCGFSTIAGAVETVRRRQQLEAEVGIARTRIETLDAATVERDFESAAAAVCEAAAEFERRSALTADSEPLPTMLPEARERYATATAALDEAGKSEEQARDDRARAAAEWKRAAEAIAAHRTESEKQKYRVTDLEAQIRLMCETHGDDEARAKVLAGLRKAREQSDSALSQTKERLRGLQPDLLETDLERIRRALGQHHATRQDAEQRRAVARHELQRDGSSDPQENLALAEARHEDARRHVARARTRAESVRLLHRLFREEQQLLAKQFTQPLMDRIASYLECLFGPGTRAVVELENNEFGGLRLVRPTDELEGAVDFATLSGGTREQLAAAVRLAMAEVLAEAHDGCLPVVFDDAFAYADPERVQTLQRMLDHAASRGLQVIVLTCTPADYAALGAFSVALRR